MDDLSPAAVAVWIGLELGIPVDRDSLPAQAGLVRLSRSFFERKGAWNLVLEVLQKICKYHNGARAIAWASQFKDPTEKGN
jgi:hypothetical protein